MPVPDLFGKTKLLAEAVIFLTYLRGAPLKLLIPGYPLGQLGILPL
ncbi:hypothetical protein AGMMS49991_05990 [Spirochaetia bacterium]|nr:hypothetical protein AGMMS49991_05990 [Spirochaetia bacterium]